MSERMNMEYTHIQASFCTKKLTKIEQKLYSDLMKWGYNVLTNKKEKTLKFLKKPYSLLPSFLHFFHSFILSFLLFPVFTHAFYDVTPEDPQHHIFSHLHDVGTMKAYPDGNFHPEKIVTRAEGLAIALRAGGITLSENFSGEIFFEDVDPAIWYAPFIDRAVELGFVSTKSYYFRPHQAITKAEFLALLFRATLVDFSPYFSQTRNLALDIPADSWFAPHFAYAKKYQIAHLPSDEFYRPHKSLSRREVAMMTYRQLRIFYGDGMTKIFVELQAQIQQFIVLLKGGKPDKAEFRLQKILKLNEQLTREKNNTDAVAARAISRAMMHLSESLRFFRRGRNLSGLENLYLAAKQADRAAKKSETFVPFVNELSRLIDETMENFIKS